MLEALAEQSLFYACADMIMLCMLESCGGLSNEYLGVLLQGAPSPCGGAPRPLSRRRCQRRSKASLQRLERGWATYPTCHPANSAVHASTQVHPSILSSEVDCWEDTRTGRRSAFSDRVQLPTEQCCRLDSNQMH